MNRLEKLNALTVEERLDNLKALIENEVEKPEVLPQFANNHIHTFYSFSPYSPTAAVYYARESGLQTAGIMDHDSIAGAFEFIEAGKIAGVATTVGLECRVSTKGTALENKRINNPDQIGVAYMALHGVPHTEIKMLQEYFEPLRQRRNERNKKMIKNINELFSDSGIVLDFEADVLPVSKYSCGGSVTERHLLYALALKIIAAAGKENVSDFLEAKAGLTLSEKQKALMNDKENPYYDYDLLGILKSALVEKIYVPATDECIHISELSALAKKTGALLCYAYLGDVGDSVTGDKKTQKFEDDYLETLFEVLKENDIDAVTYIPSRNTPEQLTRLQELCRVNNMKEISGEDINSPRQKFICPELEKPQFSHLIDATWKLIEREKQETLKRM
ncbi:MAG: PHP domain-containing protein [Clostridia bacterium]|nr:PHP domain-containing protein [Clostridia bacterium]